MDFKLNSFKSLGVGNLFEKLVGHLAWIFFAILLFIFILEAYEINNSVQVILDFNREPPAKTTDRGVRINFDNYNQVINRIQGAQTFVPTGGIAKDPFSVTVSQ